MSNIKYDMAKLSEFDEFDAAKAVNNFSCEQDYFDKLTHFTEARRDYLRLHNPIVVVFSDEAREDFFAEMKAVESISSQLEMTVIGSKLKDLKESINNMSDKALADNLRMFFASLQIAADHIVSARIQDSDGVLSDTEAMPGETKSNTEKPVVLAVDDSSVVLSVISNALGSKYRVIAVTSGKEAIKAINTYSPDFFLLDIEMPVMDGYELAKLIKDDKKFQNTPIIFLTSHAARDYVIAAKELGVNGYMLKPIEKTVLLDRIDGYFTNAAKEQP